LKGTLNFRVLQLASQYLFPYNKSICVRQYGVHALQFLVIDYGGKSIEE
jgi:hypothetical protein